MNCIVAILSGVKRSCSNNFFEKNYERLNFQVEEASHRMLKLRSTTRQNSRFTEYRSYQLLFDDPKQRQQRSIQQHLDIIVKTSRSESLNKIIVTHRNVQTITIYVSPTAVGGFSFRIRCHPQFNCVEFVVEVIYAIGCFGVR